MSDSYVHPTAIVDAGAVVGEGARIWHFVHVSGGARIGADTSLGQNVFVGKDVRVGARVKVQNNVSIYEGVEIADDVFLGPSCVFTNVINPRAFVVRKAELRPTVVETGASIGANATIVCGHRVGAFALVAAGATVTRDVAPYALVMGTPARRTGWMCRCGEQLPRGQGVRACAACGTRYRVDASSCRPTAQGEREEAADTAPVPLLDLGAQHAPLRTQLRAAFERVLDADQYILGPEVTALERALCASQGFEHALGVSSGTDALLLALMTLGVGPGDEVITTPFSFFATAGCIVRLGARPVFVDIDPATFNLDARLVEAAITPRTRAVMPVHLFGQAADLTALAAIARRHGLPIVEDAAQALGARHDGVPVGTTTSFGCFSFFPSKNLGGFGDGGLLTTHDVTLAARARVLRAHGAEPKYHHAQVGGNFRLDALQAALLRVKLPHLTDYAAARRTHAAFYDAQLAPLRAAGLLTPAGDPGHVYNQYVLRTPHRDALRDALRDAGIGSEVYYPRCLHLQECFASLGHRPGQLPHAEAAAREVLAIPVYPELTEVQRARVAETIARWARTRPA
ncbi:MAG: aminotransferase class V-fold PLP-dependent enzyme [Polyangiales bacterium]